MNEGFPTEFRKRHGKKILVGGGSAGIGAALVYLTTQIWPQVQDTFSGIMDAKAVSTRLDNYESRAHRLEAEQDALRSSIESLKQSRDYQQGLLDGIRSPQPVTNLMIHWLTNTVDWQRTVAATNLWDALTNRALRMSQFRSPDGEINVWYHEQQKGK